VTTSSGKADARAVVPAGPLQRTLLLQNRQGLHHRPAMLLINTIKEFNCSVSVEVDGFVVDGRNIIGLLSLAAGPGSKFAFTATGEDAIKALDALERLFERNFAAAYL
jgi:phosphocarrier protein HPr